MIKQIILGLIFVSIGVFAHSSELVCVSTINDLQRDKFEFVVDVERDFGLLMGKVTTVDSRIENLGLTPNTNRNDKLIAYFDDYVIYLSQYLNPWARDSSSSHFIDLRIEKVEVESRSGQTVPLIANGNLKFLKNNIKYSEANLSSGIFSSVRMHAKPTQKHESKYYFIMDVTSASVSATYRGRRGGLEMRVQCDLKD